MDLLIVSVYNISTENSSKEAFQIRKERRGRRRRSEVAFISIKRCDARPRSQLNSGDQMTIGR